MAAAGASAAGALAFGRALFSAGFFSTCSLLLATACAASAFAGTATAVLANNTRSEVVAFGVGSGSGWGVKSGCLKALAKVTQPKGMTSKVKTVEIKEPNSRETAIPRKIKSLKITLDPATRASAVITMGRVRALQERITASRTFTPCKISCWAKSTKRIELRTIIPARAIKPIMEVAVNLASIII